MRVLLTGVRTIDEFSVRTTMRLDALRQRLPERVRRMPQDARKMLDDALDVVARHGPRWLKGALAAHRK